MTAFYLQLLLNGIVAGSVYALFAVGLTMVYGVFGFINFAHGELITWGAYLLFFFAGPPLGLPLYLAVPPALVLTVLLALAQDTLVYRPLRRVSPISLLIASIGISFILRNGIRLFWGSDLQSFRLPAARGLEFAGLYLTGIQVLMVVMALVFLGFLWFLLKCTLLGKSLRAVSDNLELAGIMGVGMGKVSLAVWGLAAVFAAGGGMLQGLDTNLEPLMGLTSLIKAFAAVLLGGAGNVWGALLGGLSIGLMENLSVAVLSPGYKDFVSFAVIFTLLLFRPGGIFATATGVR
jgi:branched-subunit amino acid ABC-type transport system permease component